MKEPYMKQIQWLIIAILINAISLNAMDDKTSAPIEISGKGSNVRTFVAHDNANLNNQEITATSAPAMLMTAAALAELSGNDNDAQDQQANPKSTLSDVYKTNAYSHHGSFEGEVWKKKSQGEDRHNRKKLFKDKDREKNSKN